jgi:hypothetical protein
MTIRPEVTVITPELADAWLEANTRNRHLSEPLVSRYAEAIRRGEWQLNGDPIRFDEEGVLLDGQHRLAAVAKAHIPIHSLVLHGVPALAQDTMDTGRKRSIADVLAIRDEGHATTLAAALHILYRLLTDEWGAGRTPTTQQALALLKQHPDLRASLPVGDRAARHVPLLRAGIAAAVHYHLGQIDDPNVDADRKQFFESLVTGAGLSVGDPVLVLRETLSRYNKDRAPLSAVRVTAFLVKAWNAFREGQRISILRWSPGGAKPEAFPKAR